MSVPFGVLTFKNNRPINEKRGNLNVIKGDYNLFTPTEKKSVTIADFVRPTL